MRTIYITLLTLFISTNLFSNINTDTTYSKEWNAKEQVWQNFDRMIQTFDDGILVSETMQLFEGSEWVNYHHVDFYYNNGLVVEELEKYWNDQENGWEDNYRKLFTYNELNLTEQVLHQYIFKGHYVNASREDYKYDEDGKLIEKTVQKYEEAWTNFLKYQYYYNEAELIMEENLAYWNNDNWGDAQFSVLHDYDRNGNLVSKTKVKTENGKSNNLIAETFKYNGSQLQEHTIAQWNKFSNKWIDKNRSEYVNDLNGFVASVVNQNKKSKKWSNYLLTEFTGSSNPATGIDIADGMTFTIYPINAGREAKIEFTNPYNETYFVSVMNEDGELLDTIKTNGNEVAFNANNFYKGMYYLELQGSNLYSGKFSIE